MGEWGEGIFLPLFCSLPHSPTLPFILPRISSTTELPPPLNQPLVETLLSSPASRNLFDPNGDPFQNDSFFFIILSFLCFILSSLRSAFL